jgi:circadian clock protein KaiC
MMSIGLDLQQQLQSKLLHIHASRPTLQGLEMHLLEVHKLLEELRPQTVIIDPISSLMTIGSTSEVRGMLVRLIDLLKINQINAFFTALTHENDKRNETVDAVSSLADTWIEVQNEGKKDNRRRSLLIVKARGMGHSNNRQDFVINSKGIQFRDKEKK